MVKVEELKQNILQLKGKIYDLQFTLGINKILEDLKILEKKNVR